MGDLEDLQSEMTLLAERGNLRKLCPFSCRDGCHVRSADRLLLNLSSNDYLGIAGDEALHHEFYSDIQSGDGFLDRFALGSASSRLLTGDSVEYHQLEKTLMQAYGKEACLFFNSGYHANIGILPALAGKGDLILSDKLNHASIHDGLRLSRADNRRFRHCDYEHLERLLEQYRDDYRRAIIVTESVFSMDGDIADLRRLVALKEKYDCLLYVDEAHAVGVFGEQGLGICEEEGVAGDIDLLVGTFGKAFASIGAYLLCRETIRETLVNKSRSFIFTTALPPVVVHWNHFIFCKVLKMQTRRRALALLGERMRSTLVTYGLQTAGSTQIVPVVIGENSRTVAIAEKLFGHGILTLAVRPPTVPPGTARFRLSLSALMEWEEIQNVPSLIARELECYEI